MKIKFKKDDFNKGLLAVSRIAQSKSNNLTSNENGLLIKALNDVVEFQANDYDMAIKVEVPGIIEEPGETYVSNPYLMDLTRRLPSDEIAISQGEGDTQMVVKGGNLKFECLTMNPDNFNPLSLIETGDSTFETTSIILKELIDNTAFSCATDEGRPVFTGVLLDAKDDTITLAASDTHRMAINSAAVETPLETPMQAIIPSRMIMEIARQLPTDVPETVKIVATRNTLVIQFDHLYMQTRLIEGTYPDYRRVVPKLFTCDVTVARADITGAVERAAIVAKDSQYNVVHFSIRDDSIHITSQNPDYGTIEDLVPCQMTGDALEISFNGKYILDLLKHCHEDEVVLRSAPKSPLLVKDKETETRLYVVTPMRSR